MTSSILNYVFEKFLSNIVEIDTSKTNFSIFSGEIKLKNLKIKEEIFQNLNLPFIEVVHGHVGTLNISLKMPFFYDHAIIVYIDKIFFHARLKNINKVNKEETIKNMETFKKAQLLRAEEIMAQVDDVKRQNQESENKNKKDKKKSPGLVQKIINNLSVEINDIVFKLDDEISYPDIPYSVGIILDSVNIRSTRSDYIIPKNKEEGIPYEEVNYKVVAVDNFSIYMDCFDSKEELDFERLISKNVSKKINEKIELRNYLKDQLSFYTYCMSEVYVHSRKFDSHQYILHQLDLSVKVALNDNVDNGKPKISVKVAFSQILLSLSLKQIKTALKVLAYSNLSTLYEKGIAKEYYNKELTPSEEKSYIEGYMNYFQKKYIKKEKIEFPSSLENTEDHLLYHKISEMRTKALDRLDFITKINDLTDRIKREENSLFGKNEQLIIKLNEEKDKIIKMEEEYLKGTQEKRLMALANSDDNDEYKDLDDSYVKIFALVDILITSFTIYEKVIKKDGGKWELKDKLLSIVIQHFGVECKIQKVGLIALLSLENIIISQEKTDNPNYNKIFFGDLTIKGKILCIIFEMNPKLKKSDIRVKVWSERQVYIIVDSYTLQYIKCQIMEVLSTTIDLEEASSYAKGSVYDYIQEGYHEKVIEGNFTHSNLYLDVSLSCPIIIIPVNVFDLNNTKCLLLSLGSLNLKSILPPRVDKNINYITCEDENILYDIYRIGLLGIRMATVENCIEKNNYRGTETPLLKDIDLSIECKLLIQPKNPHFNNMIINLLISELDFQLNEFQILLIIEFYSNFLQEGNKLESEMKELKWKEMKKKREMVKLALEKENLTQEEKAKEMSEKIKKKREEMNKKRFEEKIKRSKIVYEKVIQSFSMSDHSIAKKEIYKAKNGKKAILVNFVIGKTRFAIRKIFADLTIKDYLEFQIDLIKVDVSIMTEGTMFIGFLIKHIILKDVDMDEKQQLYLNPNYVCLIESANESQIGNYNSINDIKKAKTNNLYKSEKQLKYCFIDLQMLMLGEEMDITISMNDLHIMISLNSSLRLYQFGMYYLDIYSTEAFHVEQDKIELEIALQKKINKIVKEEDKKKSEEERKQKESKKRLNNYLHNMYTVEQAKDDVQKRKQKKKKNLDEYIAYFADIESSENGKKILVTSERNRSKMRIIFNMNNTMFKLPLDPNNLEESIFSMYFDLTFTMEAKSVYDNIITVPAKKLLAQIYETNTSFMNVFLSNLELDVVNFVQNTKNFTHNSTSERIVSNFRLKCNIESYLVPSMEFSVMNIDVLMEPLMLAFGMRQVRKMMTLSDKGLEFLNYMEEKYIPFIKPENVENGLVKFPEKKKKKIKATIHKIIIKNKFKKIMKRTMLEMKKKDNKKIKKIFINTSRFNAHMEIGCKIDKICMILFDNTVESKTIMLEINISKMLVKMKTNSKIRNKENVSLALYEMLTADILPQTKYNLNQLATYIDVVFSLDTNYFNLTINEFEPLIERFNMGLTISKVSSCFKSKIYVTTNDIINFNLSTDCVRALNKFLLTFQQDEKIWQKDMVNVFSPMMNNDTKKDLQKEIQEEVVLKFNNLTGLDLVFYFDDNPNNKISMKPNTDQINYTRNKLYKARGHDKYRNPYQKTTFSVSIRESAPIEHINFQRISFRQYKLNVQNSEGKSYPIYFSIKVESSGIINTVTFCPSISFHNDTFDKIFLSINNKTIDKNHIEIEKNKSEYIPLSWLMCDYPNSSISMSLSQNGVATQIYSNISELIINPITDLSASAEKEKLKSKVKKEFPDANNPTFAKMLAIKQSEFDNRKNSKKYLLTDDKGNKSCIYLDYFLLQAKDCKNNDINSANIEKINQDKNIKTDNNNANLNTTILEINPKSNQKLYQHYEYIFSIRPFITIRNKTPFKINLNCSEGDKTIEKLENIILCNENVNNMKITIEYNNNIYSSNLFSLNQDNMYIDLNADSIMNTIKCHVLRQPIKLEIPNPQKFYCDLKDYSIQSYEYIFFFDYLLNNRLPKKIWICPCQSQSKGVKNLNINEINRKVLELPPSSLNLLSLPDYEPNIAIKDESSPWSDSFNINTIGVEGVIKLETTNYGVAPGTLGNGDNNINTSDSRKGNLFQTINEIACFINGSEIYDYSVIIVFELKYVIINNLGIDVVFKQEKYSNIYPLKSKEHRGLMYEKEEKDFRIGIKDDSSQVINYSGIFNLENELDVDLKIKINKNLPQFNNPQMKIFTYDYKDYYLLIRVINKFYDKGTVFIMLTLPKYPYLEINNMTKEPIKIYEEETPGFTIIGNLSVPFVWDNTNKHKDEIFFEILGKKNSFSFSVFKEETLEIIKNIHTLIYSVSSKNKSTTRFFLIKEKEKLTQQEIEEIRLYLRGKKRPETTICDIFIRGVGVSIIDNTPKELFYISLYNMNIKFLQNVLNKNNRSITETTKNIILKVDNFQIDYCLNDSLKTVISPKIQIVPSTETKVRKDLKEKNENFVPFLSVLVTMTNKRNLMKEEELNSFDQIEILFQEFDVKVEQYALMNLVKLATEMVGELDFAQKTKLKTDKEPLIEAKQEIPIQKLMKENENAAMNLIYYFLLGALKFNVTVRLDLSDIPLQLPKLAKRIIGTLGNTLGRITGCPLNFNEKVIENVYMSWGDIANIIIKSYISQGITQIHKVLGSLDIIGNPVKLVKNVTGGLYDFVNEPRKGFKNGPKEFGIGVAKGVGGLISGVFGGIFDFVQRITGTLYAATQTITGKDRDSMSIEDENEPQNVFSGFGLGIVGFGKEIGKGFYGCCAEPCQRASVYGFSGFCKGLCSGVLKLVISPFAGILKMLTCIVAGCKNSCFALSGKRRLKTTRFRYPRVIVEGDKKLLPYQENKAEARESLYLLEGMDTNNILFAEDFICPDCPNRLSSAVLTDKYMYVIYNLRKIIFKLELEKVTNTKMHYAKENFYMVFELVGGIKKGFPLRNDYSHVATNLQDILYHMFNKNIIMYKPDDKQEPDLIYDNNIIDDINCIDKSSYNTLIGEQSVFTDKTLISKLTEKKNGFKNNLKTINNNFNNNIGLENDSVKQLKDNISNNNLINNDDKDVVSLNVK